jgi:hypothetical protein
MQTLASAVDLSRHSKFASQALICAAFVATLLTAAIAVSDSPPKLSVGQSCEAAASGAVSLSRDKAACMSDERAAQDQIIKDWSQYPPVEKTQCIGMNRTGGPSSYVELLSCLEILRDARIIHKGLLMDPLLRGGELNTGTLTPTDLNQGSLYTGDGKAVQRKHKRTHKVGHDETRKVGDREDLCAGKAPCDAKA